MLYAQYVLIALLVWIVLRIGFIKSVTIYEYQRGLKYRNGCYVQTLQPGRYLVSRQTTHIQTVDVRPSFVTLSGQELLSSDGITLKVSLVAVYEITDANIAVNKVQSYHDAMYLTIQSELRKLVGAATVDDLLEKRNELGPKLTEAAIPLVEHFGLKLLSIDIKDIMLPGDVKKLFNQIVKAQKEGLAALEKARAETAALRSLANAAKMMEDHPGLLQLRLLQQVGETTGNTIVVGLPPGMPIVKPNGGGTGEASTETAQ